jgi:DNA-binding NtrC family response regulator
VLDPAVQDLVEHRDYPGNVRDLRQLALRVGTRHVGSGPITAGDVPEDERPGPAAAGWAEEDLDGPVRRALAHGLGLRELRDAAAESAVRVALADAGGNLHRAAARLGVSDRALQLRRAGQRDGGLRLTEPVAARSGADPQR